MQQNTTSELALGKWVLNLLRFTVYPNPASHCECGESVSTSIQWLFWPQRKNHMPVHLLVGEYTANLDISAYARHCITTKLWQTEAWNRSSQAIKPQSTICTRQENCRVFFTKIHPEAALEFSFGGRWNETPLFCLAIYRHSNEKSQLLLICALFWMLPPVFTAKMHRHRPLRTKKPKMIPTGRNCWMPFRQESQAGQPRELMLEFAAEALSLSRENQIQARQRMPACGTPTLFRKKKYEALRIFRLTVSFEKESNRATKNQSGLARAYGSIRDCFFFLSKEQLCKALHTTSQSSPGFMKRWTISTVHRLSVPGNWSSVSMKVRQGILRILCEAKTWLTGTPTNTAGGIVQ